jgi:hypothetical protein
MSFLKRLFGGGGGAGGDAESSAAPAATQEHKGFSIAATPYKTDGQFQTCGVISKEIDGARKEHRFVRADRFASQQEAADMALRKARQIIDEQGDRIFSN